MRSNWAATGVGWTWPRSAVSGAGGLTPSGFAEDLTPADRAFAELGARRALGALTTVSDALWVNAPDRLVRANSKPAQLDIARRLGLIIPETLVTNDPDAARAFIEAADGPVIYKSLSQNLDVDLGKALFTGQVTGAEIENLDLIRHTPGIFQAAVAKAFEVRATVGRPAHLRRADRLPGPGRNQAGLASAPLRRRRTNPSACPTMSRTAFRAFMDAFGLIYGAFDFIVRPDGTWVFLEVNPAGQYMWVEAKTGLPITDALVDVLSAPLPRLNGKAGGRRMGDQKESPAMNVARASRAASARAL